MTIPQKNWKVPNDVVPYCKVAAAVVFYVTIVSLGNAKSSFPATIIGNRDYSAHSRRPSRALQELQFLTFARECAINCGSNVLLHKIFGTLLPKQGCTHHSGGKKFPVSFGLNWKANITSQFYFQKRDCKFTVVERNFQSHLESIRKVNRSFLQKYSNIEKMVERNFQSYLASIRERNVKS